MNCFGIGKSHKTYHSSIEDTKKPKVNDAQKKLSEGQVPLKLIESGAKNSQKLNTNLNIKEKNGDMAGEGGDLGSNSLYDPMTGEVRDLRSDDSSDTVDLLLKLKSRNVFKSLT